MKKHFISGLLALCLVVAGPSADAQMATTGKSVTLNDIWGSNAGVFSQRTVSGVNWMKAGGFYTSLTGGKVVRYNITTGQAAETLFDEQTATVDGSSQRIDLEDYQLSADERKLLITTQEEPIYRRSSKAEFYVYDRTPKS